jgi:putative transposase
MYNHCKRYLHNPIHFFVDDTSYFITAAIYDKRPLLAEDELKIQLFELIQTTFQTFGWQLYDWVILNNHYHLLGLSRKGDDLAHIIRNIHRVSATFIHATTHCSLPVWWNYWDYCPRNEKQYLIRQNYLLYNPVKHGYVKKLNDYPFSSFPRTFEVTGRDELVKQFQGYPEYKTLKLLEDDL